MLNLKHYINITEQKNSETAERTAVFTVGRFNPPTKGHEKLISKTLEISKQVKGEPFIFVSRTHDKGKNPLTWEQKKYFIEHLIPNVTINDSNVSNAWQAVDFLDQQGFTNVYLVAGSDRITEYQQRWAGYAIDVFDNVNVINAGIRDPDSDGISAMSATKARHYANENNIGGFRAATGWSGEISLHLMHAVKAGME